MLADSNNTLVHLAPAPVVAKVATSVLSARGPSLERDLAVAAHAARAGAPVVRPSRAFEPRVHRSRGLDMTFWDLVEHDAAAEPDAAAAGSALAELHEALLDFPGPLPRFSDQVEVVGRLLADDSVLGALLADDRTFLADAHATLTERLARLEAPEQALHGQPHLDNVLAARTRLLWLDFEDACTGPSEWDFGFLPPEAAPEGVALDGELLALLRPVRSLCVAVWCWLQPDRAPKVREAAAFHLRLLRESDWLG